MAVTKTLARKGRPGTGISCVLKRQVRGARPRRPSGFQFRQRRREVLRQCPELLPADSGNPEPAAPGMRPVIMEAAPEGRPLYGLAVTVQGASCLPHHWLSRTPTT